MSNDEKIVPTFYGYIGNTLDALIVIQNVLDGILEPVSRRTRERERPHLIVSGNVFVFIEEVCGVKRWTDGLSWSPSRVLGRFLAYRKLDESFAPRRRNKKNAGPQSLVRRAVKKPARPGLKPGSGNSHGLALLPPFEDDASHLFFRDNDARTPPYGTASDDDLIKKSISVSIASNGEESPVDGQPEKQTYHLVCYYTNRDVMTGRLSRPCEVEHKLPSPLLWNAVNDNPLGGRIPYEDEQYYSMDSIYQRASPPLMLKGISLEGQQHQVALYNNGELVQHRHIHGQNDMAVHGDRERYDIRHHSAQLPIIDQHNYSTGLAAGLPSLGNPPAGDLLPMTYQGPTGPQSGFYAYTEYAHKQDAFADVGVKREAFVDAGTKREAFVDAGRKRDAFVDVNAKRDVFTNVNLKHDISAEHIVKREEGIAHPSQPYNHEMTFLGHYGGSYYSPPDLIEGFVSASPTQTSLFATLHPQHSVPYANSQGHYVHADSSLALYPTSQQQQHAGQNYQRSSSSQQQVLSDFEPATRVLLPRKDHRTVLELESTPSPHLEPSAIQVPDGAVPVATSPIPCTSNLDLLEGLAQVLSHIRDPSIWNKQDNEAEPDKRPTATSRTATTPTATTQATEAN